MKKFLLLASMLIAGGAVQAQITAEVVYPGHNRAMIRLSNGDYKYVQEQYAINRTTLYSLNHSIYKQITPPLLGAAYTQPSILYISDALFDTNPSTIEYMAKYYDVNNGTPLRNIIYSETGNQIAVLDSAYDVNIYNTPSGTKMAVDKGAYTSTGVIIREYTRVYALPGQLALRTATPQAAGAASPYPNPAKDLVNLPYAVPAGEIGTLRVYDLSGKLRASYQVDNHVGGLEMSARDLRPGVYTYSVTTTVGVTSGRRFVIE